MLTLLRAGSDRGTPHPAHRSRHSNRAPSPPSDPACAPSGPPGLPNATAARRAWRGGWGRRKRSRGGPCGVWERCSARSRLRRTSLVRSIQAKNRQTSSSDQDEACSSSFSQVKPSQAKPSPENRQQQHCLARTDSRRLRYQAGTGRARVLTERPRQPERRASRRQRHRHRPLPAVLCRARVHGQLVEGG